MLTRADEFLLAGNRSGARHELRGGASKDGKLVALAARVHKLGGLGGGSHAGMPYGVYAFELAASEIASVHTHTDASVAFRAPGHPQASFATETVVDELAYAAGVDPLTLRLENLAKEPHRRQLERAAREIGWDAHPHKTAPGGFEGGRATGIGFALSTWGGGGQANSCEVDVHVARDGSVSASVGSQDLGTGTRTYVAAIVAEELGLEVRDVEARIGRSRYPKANGSGGSTTAASLAPAVKDGAVKARLALLAHLAPLIGADAGALSIEPGRVVAPGGRALAWREACATLPEAGLTARGVFVASLQAQGVHGAQAARVEVDELTGALRVVKMVCVQDCGLALNRLAVKSQIQGGMVQALSYALFEERVIDAELGLMLNANLEDYKLAGTLEIPEMVAILDDADDRPVIGVGEPPIIPGHAAIANALYNACGVRLRELPLTCDKILMALAERG
jgi:xanthine dehydrogenase YagR molybdenum-binding subunit